jgi:pilus assembly protein Flp/PilA
MKIFSNEHGQGMTEYGLLLGLIAVAAFAAFAATGSSIKGLHEMYSTTIAGALSSST